LDQNLVDITYSSDYSFWCDTGLEKLVPMPVMGDGFILSFKILLAIANSEGGAIFIDEVENGIYYGYLKQYWNTILQTAKEFDVQVFATTHSAECVKSFINCKINQEQQDDSRLYRIEKYKEKLQAVIYTEKDLKLTINNGWELR
jgi:AAA15 family ATPase/GTPase